jgi:predicted dehydrogenase
MSANPDSVVDAYGPVLVEPIARRAASVLKFGVIGYGYWGPNVVRNLQGIAGAEVLSVCDKSSVSRRRAHKAYPSIYVSADAAEIITSPEIDVVAIVTPVWTHFELAKAALESGKHVFVEKPFTSNVVQAEQLIDLAQQKNLKIMVDHTFLFTGAVKKIKQLLQQGGLGKLYYYDSTRVNLGLFQHDVNVVWDLAPHDLSIMDYLIEQSRGVGRDRAETLEWVRRRCVYHVVFSRQHHCSCECELALAGKSKDHADRGRKEDARVERFGSGREGKGVRQRRRHYKSRGLVRTPRKLPVRGHVGAATRAG